MTAPACRSVPEGIFLQSALLAALARGLASATTANRRKPAILHPYVVRLDARFGAKRRAVLTALRPGDRS